MISRRFAVAAGAVALVLSAGCSSSTPVTAGSDTSSSSATSSSSLALAASSTTTSSVPSSSVVGTSSTAKASPTTSGPAASGKAAFLEQGNAICKKMNDASAALTKSYGPKGPTTSADTVELLDKNADLIDDSVQSLRQLPQPAGDELKLAKMYDEVGQLASLARQMAGAIKTGDTTRMGELQTEGNELQTKVNGEFTAYGLVECGKGG